MRANLQNKIEIIELSIDENRLSPLKGEYVTDSYYEISMKRRPKAWKIELYLKSLEKPLKKTYKGRLIEEQIEEPRTFAATLNGKQIGWIELGYHKWNNRMRVWEFLVKEEFRRKGIGTTLMRQAVEVAKQKGARMLVLETQSCDVSAIDFYLKQGFDLIGFDLTAYSNEDIKKKEVRLEFGLSL